MTRRWAVRLPRQDAHAAARLRQTPGVQVHESPESVWLHGDRLDEALEHTLRLLPGGQRFHVLPDRQLRPVEKRVPCGHLPREGWMPLADWLVLELQPAALAGQLEERIPLQLVRSTVEKECEVLITQWERWSRYGEHAPQVRLNRWQFAAAEDGRAIIRGTPPPPLPGERLAVEDGVGVPAGWTWSPAVDAPVVRELLGAGSDDLVLLRVDGTWERLASEDFVRASRSAIRFTNEALSDGGHI